MTPLFEGVNIEVLPDSDPIKIRLSNGNFLVLYNCRIAGSPIEFTIRGFVDPETHELLALGKSGGRNAGIVSVSGYNGGANRDEFVQTLAKDIEENFDLIRDITDFIQNRRSQGTTTVVRGTTAEPLEEEAS